MSQRQGPSRGGSVKKARERAQAGIPLDSTQKQKGFDQYQQASTGERIRPQMPASALRGGQGQIGVAISRPTQIPQWPLAGPVSNSANGSYQPPVGRGEPPQRPPRPSHVPSMLDGSRLQDPTPTFLYTPGSEYSGQGDYYEDTNIVSPSTPATASSRPSTVSSVGSIPEFPVPAIPQSLPIQGPRRTGNLGPPPSSRRGASSYYSQASFVSPIPEESPRGTLTQSHLSYASSAAIPPNWSPNPESPVSPGFLYDDFYSSGGPNEDGRLSRGSQDDSEDRGLIRSASVGKRAKPSMVLTKGVGDSDNRITQMPNPLMFSKNSEKVIEPEPKGLAPPPLKPQARGQRQTVWPTIGDPDSPLANGTGLIDPTPSTSSESVPTMKGLGQNRTDSSLDIDPRMKLSSQAAASSLAPPLPTQARTPSPGGFSRLSAIRRPPRLDIDAVRDAEARGSLTSLPDLILRATKLAAMMDRGKRPGSRMNDLNDFPNDIDLSSRDKDTSPANGRNSTLSGMLASFPPPGVDSPRGNTPRPISAWPTGYGPSGAEKGSDGRRSRKPGRRCCGMPLWAFVLTSIVLLIIIAAAVVIPLYFFVIKKNNDSSNQLTPLQSCQQDPATACQNDGMASLTTGRCSCICINGFTGPTCTTLDQGACAATSFALDNSTGVSSDVQISNATLGDAITRLISGAQTNFSIPLSQTVLLSRFNTAGLSCISQNALVTFDGQNRRIGAANAVIIPSSGTSSRNSKRQSGTPTGSAPESVGTASSGIIFDTGSPSDSASGSATPPSTVTSNAPATDLFNITQEVLDFSRVAVLYVLQEETLDNAVLAQSNLQRFFGLQSFTNGAARNVSMGNGNTVSLLDFRIDVGNGVLGGKLNASA